MTEPDPVRRLLHRWFVQYNPLYLFSAALVLGGVTMMSRGLVQAGSTLGALAVSAIAEIYAWTLIGSAALLMRAGLRRPAVILALLAVLYQGDLTLHCETASFHGLLGAMASAAWLVSFAGKLHALAAIMGIRLAARASVVIGAGALGLALVPWLARSASAHTVSLVVGLWVFSLAAAVLWGGPTAESRVALDDWGRVVLRRAVRATWSIWGGLALFHVWFWSRELGVAGVAVVPVTMLVAARHARSDLTLALVNLAVFALVARVAPAFASLTAALAAVTFALRASGAPCRVERPTPNGSPYRTAEAEPPPAAERWQLEPPSHGRRARLLLAALVSLWAAAWTAGWSGGRFPEHVVALDLLFALAAATWAVATKSRAPWYVLVAGAARLGVERGLIASPTSTLGWGLLQVAAGFLLLVGTVLATLRWRARASAGTAATAATSVGRAPAPAP